MVGGVWRVGQVVDGRYEVAQVHEGGGMGLMYRVRHLEWATDLAVKCPRAELFRTDAQRDLFTAEAEIWVSLGLHPNVCACHYVRVLDGLPRVFAEYVADGSLHDWIDDRRLYAGDPAEALARILDVAVQAAWGLDHAHGRGVVHQDVKPANVLLDATADGIVAKVTDFGLARARATVTGPGPTGTPADKSVLVSNRGLTPAYASPEQGMGLQVGRRSDIYSLAVSVLEMFTGGISWMLGAVAGEALAIRRTRAEPGIPDLPDGLVDLLERSLSPDPAARPASMGEFAGELIGIHRQVTGSSYPRAVPVVADLRADELNNRGVSLLDLGRPAEAGEAFATALAVDPQHLNATYNAGLLRWRRGEITDEDLVVALDTAAAGQSGPGEARRLLAEVHRERGDREEADALLGRRPPTRSGGGRSRGTRRLAWYAHRKREAVYDPFFDMEVMPATPSIRVRFTDDGTRAVSVCDGVLRVWDVHEGRCLREVAAPVTPKEEPVRLGISGDGRYAITAGLYTVRFWDLAEGRCLRVFDAVFDGRREGLDRILHWPNSVDLSGDGRVAVVAYHGGIVLVWDFPSGALRLVLDGHDSRATAAVDHHGRFVLGAGRADGTARVWDVTTGRCVHVLDSCERVHGAWLAADAERAAVAGDGEIRVWDFRNGRARVFQGVGRLPRVAMAGDVVVSMDVDDTVRLWTMEDGRCRRTLRGDGSRVLAAHVDPEAGVLRTAWQDDRLRWWALPERYTAPPRPSRPRRHPELSMFRSRVADLTNRARTADEPRTALELLAEARAVPGHEREPGLLAAWRELGLSATRVGLRSAWPAGVFDAGADAGQVALDTSADGRVAVSGGVGGTVRVWNLESGTCKRVTEKRPHLVGAVGISDDGTRAMYTTGGVITAWSVRSGERVTVVDHPSALGMTAFDSAARMALVAGHDALRLWNLDTGACERKLPPHPHTTALWFGPGLAVSGGRDGTVRLWDLDTGRCARTFRGHTQQVMSVCLSADGRHVLSSGGYTDRTIRLWDAATGTCLRVFGDDPDSRRGIGSVPKVPSKRVRFSPDGRFAISGGSDTTVRIWELATGRCLCVLEGHEGTVSAVLISPDARFALSAGTGGAVRRWELDWDLRVP
ncbi:protein kinase [Streptomyces sp. ML-6]|uniref:protein kinase domain-containing protein n=1 Tax=Streptomyces sp. ML-6 TaxID=2982693 RepID=UPI0024BF65F3|nr:protein kinase [Streptomyces sp. ML-6]MDK0524351.1 protein kinase [Streptomyces sp. ML-6]